jgi:hypothetical protein
METGGPAERLKPFLARWLMVFQFCAGGTFGVIGAKPLVARDLLLQLLSERSIVTPGEALRR